MEFIVQWANDKHTLKNFEDVLKAAYAEDFYNISLKAVHHSKLTFICTIPFWMKERFIELTEKAVDILSSGAIVEVVVDEAVIIDITQAIGKIVSGELYYTCIVP